MVPHGAGLGGGSGNAAAALWAANELSGCPATEADLLKWSGEIGSDISVFFSLGPAYCTGRCAFNQSFKRAASRQQLEAYLPVTVSLLWLGHMPLAAHCCDTFGW